MSTSVHVTRWGELGARVVLIHGGVQGSSTIPAGIGAASPEEQARMGKAVRRVVLPKKETLEQQLAALRERGTPLLVVTGGWSPALTVVGDTVAALGGGR